MCYISIKLFQQMTERNRLVSSLKNSSNIQLLTKKCFLPNFTVTVLYKVCYLFCDVTCVINTSVCKSGSRLAVAGSLESTCFSRIHMWHMLPKHLQNETICKIRGYKNYKSIFEPLPKQAGPFAHYHMIFKLILPVNVHVAGYTCLCYRKYIHTPDL
jgi:hypothetical protein